MGSSHLRVRGEARVHFTVAGGRRHARPSPEGDEAPPSGDSKTGSHEADSPSADWTASRPYGIETDVASPELVIVKVPVVDEA
jgi:hypothetical protein